MKQEKNLKLAEDKRAELFVKPILKLCKKNPELDSDNIYHNKLEDIYPENEFIADYFLSDPEDLITKIIELKLQLLEKYLK